MMRARKARVVFLRDASIIRPKDVVIPGLPIDRFGVTPCNKSRHKAPAPPRGGAWVRNEGYNDVIGVAAAVRQRQAGAESEIPRSRNGSARI